MNLKNKFGVIWPALMLWIHNPTVASAATPPTPGLAQPAITAIRLEGDDAVVTARVPAGLRRVTLESSSRVRQSVWEPRRVARLDGNGGEVIFRLPRSADLEFMRVRGDAKDALPASFYRGTNLFAGTAVDAATGSGDRNVNEGPLPGRVFLTGDSAPIGGPLNSPAGDSAQPRDVVESDIWKIRGDTLYFFNQYRGLQVIDLAQPDAPVVRGTLELPAAGEQMYVLGADHVVLLARDGCGYWGTDAESRVLIVDVTGGAPRTIASLPVPGSIQESRLVGTALYVASQTYRPRADAKGAWEYGSFVSSFDLSQPARPEARSSAWVPGSGNVITATDRFLFVATPVYTNRWWNGANWMGWDSQIQRFDISAPDGTLRGLSAIHPFGQVKDKFKMNLNGDTFTVVTERWINRLTTVVETFSLAQPDNPRKLGELKIIEGEALFGTRFDGTKLYAVTFLRIDPLWVIDLSNPAEPRIAGEVEVPGWSTYLHPLGDRLVTVGIDNSNGWRVAVSLFDVTDPARPTLLSRVPLGENSSWSEANSDEKAFGVLPEAGLILVPVASYSTNLQQGVQLIDLNRDSLAKRGFIEHGLQARRATVHRDRILSISARELLTVDATNRDQPAVRAETTLSWNVDRVFVAGDYLIELSNANANYRFNAGGSPVYSAPRLRVVSLTNAAEVIRDYSLTHLPIIGATKKDGRLYLAQGVSAQTIWWDGKVNLKTPITVPGTLKLTVVDLSALPAVSAAGASEITITNGALDDLEALWPKPDVLVWASRGYDYRVWGDIRLGGPSLMPVTDVAFWPGRWFPYYGAGRSLFAFELSEGGLPRFKSEVEFAATNNWFGFSSSFAADGLVQFSHQNYESKITGTNVVITTNWMKIVVTNVATIEKVTSVPHFTIVTNYETVTNWAVFVTNHWTDAVSADGGKITAGGFHTLGVKPDGTPWAWGANWDGQLGDGTTASRGGLGPVIDLYGVKQLAAGSSHSLALKHDGTVWAWGNDGEGQLGNGLTVDPGGPPLPEFGANRPVAVIGLAEVSAVAAGYFHSLALLANGTVWAWGANWNGQLGDGSIEKRSQPVEVPGLSEGQAIAGGTRHSLALRKDGTVWAWGGNAFGQLGDGTVSEAAKPQPVPGLSNVIAVAAGEEHSLALKADGTVWSWGRNDHGQLGQGSVNDARHPQAVIGLDEVIAIAIGPFHSLALKADGTVMAWGWNDSRQLGEGSKISHATPQPVAGLTAVAEVAAGETHSVALRSDGSLWSWGDHHYGQLGDGGQVRVAAGSILLTNNSTIVTYTTMTNYTAVTNLTYETRHETVTNSYPVQTWSQRHYLDVLDYTDPAHPVVRRPVSIPGTLNGISHGGALLYTVAGRSETNRWAEWLEASAYDGVAAYLVDALVLPDAWPHPLLARGAEIYLGRPAPDTNSYHAVEVWALSEAGKFTKLGVTEVGGVAQQIVAFGDLLAVQAGNRVDVWDANNPARLVLTGSGGPGGCLGIDLNRADGKLGSGLWIPLGDYGVSRIDLKKP